MVWNSIHFQRYKYINEEFIRGFKALSQVAMRTISKEMFKRNRVRWCVLSSRVKINEMKDKFHVVLTSAGGLSAEGGVKGEKIQGLTMEIRWKAVIFQSCNPLPERLSLKRGIYILKLCPAAKRDTRITSKKITRNLRKV